MLLDLFLCVIVVRATPHQVPEVDGEGREGEPTIDEGLSQLDPRQQVLQEGWRGVVVRSRSTVAHCHLPREGHRQQPE